MEKFAKLFESEVYGQILVIMDTEDGDPVLKISVLPDGLGVCSSVLTFEDTDYGYEKREKNFNELTKDTAENIAQCIFESVAPISAAFS